MVKPLILPTVFPQHPTVRPRFQHELLRRERPLNIIPDNVLAMDFNEERGDRVIDESRHGHHGILYGQPRWWRSRNEEMGSALRFDGIDDYVNCGLDIFSQADFINGVTLAIWANIRENPPYATQMVLLTIEERIKIIIDQATGRFQFIVYDGAEHDVQSDAPIPSGEWHHLGGTWDGLNMLAYIDGDLQTDIDVSGMPTIDIVNRITAVGSDRDSFHQFQGLLDEPRIYNRNLTALEMRKLAHTFD